MQAKPAQLTNEKIEMLLDYLATYPDAKIRFHASNMMFHTDSDAVYLVVPKERSRVAGYFYMSNNYGKYIKTAPNLNGPVQSNAKH